MKLKFEFAAELPIRQTPRDIVAMTGLFPLPGRRALAFGWVDDGQPLERYWLASISADGIEHRVLPSGLTDRFVALTARSPSSDGSFVRVQAFGFGEGVGLLLGSGELHLFESLHAEPQVIAIDDDIAFAGEDSLDRSGQAYRYPLRCGHASGRRVPVVFSDPSAGLGEGRHACLLEIDVDTRRARWTGTDPQGAPHGIRHADLVVLCDEPQPGSIQGPAMGWSKPPLILDCACDDAQWRLYVGGYSAAYHRFGLAPSLLCRCGPDLSLREAEFQAREDSFGRLCRSGDRMILTPLRKNGPGKGKQTIVHFADRREESPTLPRGYSRHSIVEYGDGSYWLLPMQWGYAHSPVVCCSED